MKVSLFRSIFLFFFFRKRILRNKTTLLNNFGAKIDYINRIYTVLNIPKELIEEPYDFRTSDINSISQNYIKAYSGEMQQYLNSLGLRELFDIYEVKKVDKYSYLIIIGFSLFNTKKVATNLMYAIPTLLALSLIILLMVKFF